MEGKPLQPSAHDAVLINEKPVRTAGLPLVPEVRPSPTVVPGALVVTGIFD
ncbi:hypothetical protein [Streptomyces sp. DSM 40907]|uniref:hypothetical protein n=1 Tax=Streptomyces kutzneri TaxID=3051179 RepID=UPI0028D4A58A|nr:hypothetical protein [Streptomyces sp. DSM 40907]